MSSWAEIGWRIGNLVAGAGALYLADAFGWRAAYLCMAAFMAPGMIAALLAPEPASDFEAHKKPLNFVAAIVDPIKDLIIRLGPRAVLILIMVAGFRMPGYLSSAMAMPLFKSLNYSNSDIATVTKLFGFWTAMFGTIFAGVLVTRFGIMASLVFGTIFASASHLSLAYLAAHAAGHGGDFWLFAATRQYRQFRLRLRLHRAHYLYVVAGRHRICRQPICAADLDLRLSRQHSRRRLGFYDRAREF